MPANKKKKTSILIVEDNALVSEALHEHLTEAGYAADTAMDAKTAQSLLEKHTYDLILLDMMLPDAHGKELLSKWKEKWSGIPIIVLTAHADVDSAVSCMKAGAYDFLSKPVEPAMLEKRITNAIQQRDLSKQVTALTELSHRDVDTSTAASPVMDSPRMQPVVQMAKQVAQHDVSCILIRGETGSGKGVLARTLHKWGPRHDKPFVEVNCSALPATLVESELFGHQKGAFTDAKEERMGVFEMADKGTLFLDEIGDMDSALQTKLLKVLEEQKFRRIGGTKDIDVDVAVIAATNQDLEKLSQAGSFRSDLYYRLNVFPIQIPPLRERKEDIPILAKRFTHEFAAKFNKEIDGLTEEAEEALMRHEWSGNIRELRNLIERCCLLATENVIGMNHLLLPPDVLATGQKDISAKEATGIDHGQTQSESTPASSTAAPGQQAMPLAEAEALAIKAAMNEAGNNKNEAARILGIHRTTLYKKLEEYEIVEV